MKLLPLILLVALVGCGRSEPRTILSTEQLLRWVPLGTYLSLARQTMEQRQFACSVVSYDKPEQMAGDPEAHLFGGLVSKDDADQIVTNVTYLVCTRSNVEVRFCFANGVARSVGSKQ